MVKFYFNGTDNNGQYELWQSDGTVAGTVELSVGAGLAGQTGGLAPRSILPYGTQVLFDGQDASGNQALWSYSTVTGAVAEIPVAGSATTSKVAHGFQPSSLIAFNNSVYFTGYASDGTGELWQSDGTSNGTAEVMPIQAANPSYGLSPGALTVFNNQIVFEGTTGTYTETYSEFSSDGTAAGTVPNGLKPPAAAPVVLGNALLYNYVVYAANSQTAQLYSSVNGNLTPGQGGSYANQPSGINPVNFTIDGAIALFSGRDTANHEELYRTDGTTPGTQELAGIAGESATGLNPSAGAIVGSRVVFAGTDATGTTNIPHVGLWSTDGTVAGTTEITVAGANSSGVHPLDLTAISATQAVFNGENAAGQYNLWITDGTSAGTYELTGVSGAAGSPGLNPGNIVSAAVIGAACYCSGTLILTPGGECPIEDLAIGDIVVTASGNHRLIRWIGRRSYAGRFLAAHPHLQPIRFHAGSLGGGLPRRDLLVSPEHAMVIDGLLIPARCLANGRTIRQEPGLARVDYLHVELSSHDVLLAEGAPSESFLDDDSRGRFQNGSEFAILYPDAADCGCFCAPKVEAGFMLRRIRARLAGLPNPTAQAA